MSKYNLILILGLSAFLLTACSGNKKEDDSQEKGVSAILPDVKNEVSVQSLKKCDFNHELVSNGKISVRGKADLRFETSEVIAHIYVKNGSHVQKGQKLAELERATPVVPFDGMVANLFARTHNLAGTSDIFCSIIDTRHMEADFTVLENELAFIKIGDKVVISPYAGGDPFEGNVSEINPLL